MMKFDQVSSRRIASRAARRGSAVPVLIWLFAAALPACGSGLGADEEPTKRRGQTKVEQDAGADGTANDQSSGGNGNPGRDPSEPESDDPEATETTDGPGPGEETADATQPATDSSEPTEPVVAPEPGERTRVARLTHSQYQNTIEELIGVSDGLAAGLAPDALNGFAFKTSIDFRVDARLAPQYRTAAESLALRVVEDDAVWDRVVPCSDGSCAAEFITGFGLKAFRRPLDSAEQEQFAALFQRGDELVGSGDAFADGVQLVVEAMLQAPQFLYRTELGEDVGADGSIACDAYEVASRLAFFLYDAMPDPALFDAAAANQLGTADEVRAQVARMLEDPRATRNLVSFHEQAWHFNRYSKIAPSPDTFPGLPADIAERMGNASSRFIEEVITSGGGFGELLTAPYAFADDVLAPLYGTSAEGLTRVELDPSARKGYLMQVGFLTANAYAAKTDPIHRGLFVVRDLLCRTVPDPPANASQQPFPADAPAPKTTREEVSVLTGQEGCNVCHRTFNPAGFAFEGFDAVGQARSEENGVTVDTAGEFTLDGEMLQFDDALGLVDALAGSAEARDCYSSKWLQFAHGRALTQGEVAASGSLRDAQSIEALVTELVATPGFLSRNPNEVAP